MAKAIESSAKSNKKPAKADKGEVVKNPPTPVGPAVENTLEAKLVHLIAEEMAIEEAELTADSSFSDDLGLDEIDIAELLKCAEEQFQAREFTEDEWEDCRTVGDFVQLAISHIDKKNPKPAKPAAKKK